MVNVLPELVTNTHKQTVQFHVGKHGYKSVDTVTPCSDTFFHRGIKTRSEKKVFTS